jgi:outer membrane lipoprotein LolB
VIRRWVVWRSAQRALLASLICLLAACASAPPRTHQATAALQAAQAAREVQLAARTHWTLAAHLAVSNGHDGGSGELEWHQDGSAFVFSVRAANGKTVRLSGDANHAILEGAEAQPSEDSDAQRLLRERVGWDVPLNELRAWVLGLRAPASAAQLQFGEQDLPAVLDQDGWKVEYLDWFTDRSPALPRRVFASQGQTRVKLAIQTWSFEQ